MLPRKKRVTRLEFPAILQARSFHSSHFSARVKKLEGATLPRFSFVVSKKVEKTAVGRNTLKRRMSAVVESVLEKEGSGVSAIICAVFAKKGAEALTFQQIKSEIEALLREVGIVKV